jgi:nucleotide-binding universal stress UspA family protein
MADRRRASLYHPGHRAEEEVCSVFGNVLVVVDSSPAARRAVAEAVRMAGADRGRMTLLLPVAAPPWWASHAPVSPAQLLADAQRECAALLRELADMVPADVPLTTLMPTGRTVDAVLRELDRRPHDVVVMSASPRRRRARRSAPARLSARCRLPLLVVPTDGPPVPPSVARRRAPRRRVRVGEPVRL